MSVLFTSIFSGIQIIWDKQFGFLKETLIAPVSRVSIMIGQTLGGASTALIQGFIIIIISLFLDKSIFQFPGFFIALFFMVLIGITFTALGIAIASKMEDIQGFQLIINLLIFPLFFLSGALFPLTNAPPILRFIAMVDPLTYGVEGVRYGLLGSSPINPLVSLAVLGIFGLIVIVIGANFFNKTKV
jgi:ABC-2 type transport system permease protein